MNISALMILEGNLFNTIKQNKTAINNLDSGFFKIQHIPYVVVCFHIFDTYTKQTFKTHTAGAPFYNINIIC